MADFEELVRLANNVPSDSQVDNNEPCADDIARWQRLFSYTYSEAKEKIENHRNCIARKAVTEDLWAWLKPQFEGYDKEAYEHSLTLPPSFSRALSDQKPPEKSSSDTHASFVFKMEGPLEQANVVREALGSDSTPNIQHGSSEDGPVNFCRVDSDGKAAVDQWLSQRRIPYRPTFVREMLARKDLSGDSVYPFLGVDTTLPQHRPTVLKDTPEPQQKQYPVWYFFYGTLADTSKLAKVLQLPEEDITELHPASVGLGTVKIWGDKFKALVDGQNNSRVQGCAYEVQTAKDEEDLRFYETAMYEVVRCSIDFESPDRKDAVPGLTFRFIDRSQLS